jgi:hypothetical protein
MSHYSVLVIGEDVERQLVPFQENNMGDCPREFLRFHDTEDENRREWETGSVEMVQLDNGERVYTWDARFKSGDIFNQVTTIPDHLQRITVAHKDRFTFDEYMKDWHGTKGRDPEMNRYGYWENPNKKWDWFSVGGRWSNKLLLKDGTKADECEVQHLDLEAIRAAKKAEAERLWDKFHSAIGRLPTPKSWAEMREKHEKDIDAARAEYGEQPAIKFLNASKDNDLKWALFDNEDLLKPREVYIAGRVAEAFCTFAVVKDGKWFERGKMGWWACVSGEKDPETWVSQFNNLLESLPFGTQITVVDCHI